MGIYWILTAVILLLSLGLAMHLFYQSKRYKMRAAIMQQAIDQLKEGLLKARQWEALIPDLQKIAHLDHDVNTPLCVITLSIDYAQEIVIEQNNEILRGKIKNILEAVEKVREIMEAVRILKSHPLLKIAPEKPAAPEEKQ